ncbi:unnamed protein product [Echinostoma caproni]|uniref:BLOC-1-related complex subunit 5 n=1 Tax=Echinostoma caproni TaxID=27848 RepID=A0A183AX76_9TREM|nr:unnamed protein product [Echinostoma caproni]
MEDGSEVDQRLTKTGAIKLNSQRTYPYGSIHKSDSLKRTEAVKIDRVQDSVARLLTSLNASVQEEIRHFNAVYIDQPWLLRLDTRPNWTDAVASHLSSVERVHQVLLVYVRQATTAINTLRELMKANLQWRNYDESATPVISPTPLYKPILLKSYKQLQESLYTAQALLNSANQVLLTSLNTRSQEILSHFNRTVHNKMTSSDSNVPLLQTSVPLDWIRTKHYAELAYIDLLVNHVLRSDNWKIWSDFAKENESAPNPRHVYRLPRYICMFVVYVYRASTVGSHIRVVDPSVVVCYSHLRAVCWKCAKEYDLRLLTTVKNDQNLLERNNVKIVTTENAHPPSDYSIKYPDSL